MVLKCRSSPESLPRRENCCFRGVAGMAEATSAETVVVGMAEETSAETAVAVTAEEMADVARA
jgi:hypothetical protein